MHKNHQQSLCLDPWKLSMCPNFTLLVPEEDMALSPIELRGLSAVDSGVGQQFWQQPSHMAG